jgi:hypothetical protein
MALEHRDAVVLVGNRGGGSQSGDAPADDDDVEVVSRLRDVANYTGGAS